MVTSSIARETYTQNDFATQSPAKLIAMLYEGIIRFNGKIEHYIKEDDREESIAYVTKSVNIFLELISSLNFDDEPEISMYLYGLYTHQIKLLNNAVLDSDLSKMTEVNRVVKELLDAWKETTGIK